MPRFVYQDSDSMNSIFCCLHPLCGVLACAMATPALTAMSVTPLDKELLSDLVRFTARTLETASPVPFGALIVDTRTGKQLLRATNKVMKESDPSSHAEVRAIRLACKKLKNTSLAGYTMYSTCEPCPMCMANALWAQLDRVVYGATIADANQYCLQIQIPAREIAQRSDMTCLVEGPVLRGFCNTLFTHPNMQKAFKKWSNRKRGPHQH